MPPDVVSDMLDTLKGIGLVIAMLAGFFCFVFLVGAAWHLMIWTAPRGWLFVLLMSIVALGYSMRGES